MAQANAGKLVIVVPVYNEALNLEQLISDFESCPLADRIERFEFVDDGSQDDSYKLLTEIKSKISINVTKHEKNLGVASAFESGFQSAIKNASSDVRIVVTIEADNTSDLAILPALIEIIDSDQADVALASCYREGGGVKGTNIYRKFLSRTANILLKIRYPQIQTATYSSFYRAYRFSLLQRIFSHYKIPLYKERGFVCMVEMLLVCRAFGARFRDFPMMLDASRRKGKSKMKILRTILGYVRLVFRQWPSQ